VQDQDVRSPSLPGRERGGAENTVTGDGLADEGLPTPPHGLDSTHPTQRCACCRMGVGRSCAEGVGGVRCTSLCARN
jgi:hypothetical protein